MEFPLGLYYKAGGVPWRMSRSATDMTTLYVGVSFYRALERLDYKRAWHKYLTSEVKA